MAPPERTPVTLVVPCYNEETGLRQLAEKIETFMQRHESRYHFFLVVIDDGSTDFTWDGLQALFGDQAFCQLIRCQRNRGITAALARGCAISATEIICTMDSDCSYDPELFAAMIPLLQSDVGMVTASPYHQQGSTHSVSPVRLILSRGLSMLYGFVLYQDLATCTCCFRVYRRSALQAVEAGQNGFAGIAEIAVRLDHAGYRIVEYPAVLRSRVHGVSKMRILTTIFGHLRLLSQFGWAKLVHSGPPMPMRLPAVTVEDRSCSHAD